MKIVYLGNYGNPYNNPAEESIERALKELGHKVIPFDEKKFDIEELIKAANQADLFMFFKAGTSFGVTLEQLANMLSRIYSIKVCWYWDKVWGERYDFMDVVIPLTDFVFMTDGSFYRRMNLINVFPLRQGLDVKDCYLAEKKKSYEFDIVFAGSVYGERAGWVQRLNRIYGQRFVVVQGVFDKELNHLCNSAKVFVSPKFPMDNFYWSNRVYQIVGRGGFLIHPRLEGLEKEFVDGKHLVFYDDFQDMIEKINYYLEHKEERDKIRKEGLLHCKRNFTYHHSLKEMFKIIKNSV